MKQAPQSTASTMEDIQRGFEVTRLAAHLTRSEHELAKAGRQAQTQPYVQQSGDPVLPDMKDMFNLLLAQTMG